MSDETFTATEGGGHVSSQAPGRHAALLRQLYQAASEAHGELGVDFDAFSAHLLACAEKRVRDQVPDGSSVAFDTVLSSLHSQDLYLALAMGQGDEKAWNRFFDQFWDFLSKSATRLARDLPRGGDFAADVLSDLFFSHRQTGCRLVLTYGGIASLRRWLWLSLKSRIIDSARKYSREVLMPPGLDDAGSDRKNELARVLGTPLSPEDRAIRELDARLLRQVVPAALASLTPRELAVFRMRFVDGWQQRDIARAFHVHESRVSNWISRATEKLFKNALERMTRDHGLSYSDALELLGRAIGSDVFEGRQPL